MTIINLAESQNLPFALPAPLFRVPYTLRGSTVLVALHLSRVLYKFTPFYAKQTQFPKARMKLNFYSTRDYENKPPLPAPGKQTQSNPISKGAPILPKPHRLTPQTPLNTCQLLDLLLIQGFIIDVNLINPDKVFGLLLQIVPCRKYAHRRFCRRKTNSPCCHNLFLPGKNHYLSKRTGYWFVCL